MNLRSLFLGIAFLVALSGAITFEVIYVSNTVSYGAWAASAVLLALWVFFSRAMLVEFLTRKSTRFGANLAFVIFLVLGILVFVNILAKEHSFRKDVTRTGANSLSEQSRKIVGELPQDVHAYLFTSLNEKDKGEETLRRYAYYGKRFKYEFVDTDRYPTRAEAMGVKRKGTVVLTLGDTNKKVSLDGATEEQVTNGLIKLLRANDVSIYFTTGHEEHPLAGDNDPLGYSLLVAELTKQGYSVKELNLLSTGSVPADAAVVVVGGPKRAFFPKELDILGAWVKAGGHAAFAVDLDLAENGLAKGSRQVAELVKSYGIEIHNDMLVDPMSKAANVEPQVLLGFAASKDHPISRDFPHSASVANFLFPLTTYLTPAEKPALLLTPLATTSPNAWAESDWNSIRSGTVSYNEGRDHRGQMDLAEAAEAPKADGKKGARLVVFANALFATNNLLDKAANRDLALNSLAWLAEDDRFISIRANEDADALRPFNSGALNLILLFTVFVVPLLVIGVGVSVWWRRSKL